MYLILLGKRKCMLYRNRVAGSSNETFSGWKHLKAAQSISNEPVFISLQMESSLLQLKWHLNASQRTSLHLNVNCIEMLSVYIEMNSVHIEMNSVYIEMNLAGIEMNLVYIKMNSVYIEMNSVYIKMISVYIEMNSVCIEMNSVYIHLDAIPFSQTEEKVLVQSKIHPSCAILSNSSSTCSFCVWLWMTE